MPIEILTYLRGVDFDAIPSQAAPSAPTSTSLKMFWRSIPAPSSILKAPSERRQPPAPLAAPQPFDTVGSSSREQGGRTVVKAVEGAVGGPHRSLGDESSSVARVDAYKGQGGHGFVEGGEDDPFSPFTQSEDRQRSAPAQFTRSTAPDQVPPIAANKLAAACEPYRPSSAGDSTLSTAFAPTLTHQDTGRQPPTMQRPCDPIPPSISSQPAPLISYASIPKTSHRIPDPPKYHYEKVVPLLTTINSSLRTMSLNTPSTSPSAFEPQLTRQVAAPVPREVAKDVPLIRGLKGLHNLGNTCYLSATMQCLMATTPFSQYFLSGDYKDEINRSNLRGTAGSLAEATAKLVKSVNSKSSGTVVSPSVLRDNFVAFAPQFHGTAQQDAQEFLDYMLDGLNEDLDLVLRKPPPIVSSPERDVALERLPEVMGSDRVWGEYRERNDSVIVDFFQGQFRNKVECLVDNCTSTTFSAFQTLSLPIPTHPTTTIHLEDCLDEFLAEEILTGDDAWNCPTCRRPSPTSKRLSLTRQPQFLIVHLNRFSSVGTIARKINTPVVFPLDLEIARYLPPMMPGLELNQPREESTLYQLYGVVNHATDDGQSRQTSSGHYTAMVLKDGEWYHIDDETVTRIVRRQVLAAKTTAYLLWYQLVKPAI